MGIATLPNGMEYFSLAEELESFFEIVYPVLSPVNIGILTILTVLFVFILVLFAFLVAKNQAEAAL